jgi:hypothetical protein
VSDVERIAKLEEQHNQMMTLLKEMTVSFGGQMRMIYSH